MYDNSFRGQVYSDASATAGTAGTGEQTLKSFTVPANSLCQGSQALEIRARFKVLDTNGVNLKLYFGSEVIATGSISAAGTAQLNISAKKTGSKTQLVWASGSSAGTNIAAVSTRATEDDTAAILIKATATGTVSGASAECEELQVEFLQSA